MNTIVDLQSAVLEAKAQAAEWMAEFEAEWNGPLILAEQTMAFLSMTPQERAMLAEADPALHSRITANVRQLHRRVMRPSP